MNGLLRNVDDLRILAEETCEKINVLEVSETNLHDIRKTVKVAIDFYTCTRKDLDAGLGWGVGCFARSDFIFQLRKDLEMTELETMWADLLV